MLFVPEQDALYRALPRLKEELQLNVEIANPAHFIPELPQWQERSLFIERRGRASYYHYDPYAQALAKIVRGHAKDLADVAQLSLTASWNASSSRAVRGHRAEAPSLSRGGSSVVPAASERRAASQILGPGQEPHGAGGLDREAAAAARHEPDVRALLLEPPSEQKQPRLQEDRVGSVGPVARAAGSGRVPPVSCPSETAW
jgi:hypothetical protein